MNAGTRLGAFALALAAIFAVSVGVGAAWGPTAAGIESEAPPPEGQGVVAGLDGYRLSPTTAVLDRAGGRFEFTIEGSDGEAERHFEPVHERRLHLIIVDRELTTFHHVHPKLGSDGVWSVDLPALHPGSYRAVADFMIEDGPRLALGSDLAVPGRYQPEQLADPARTSRTDGYQVAVEIDREAGGEIRASFTVRRHGRLVTDLEPYLGADGHLVAMRQGDLAYAHVHPVEDEEPGPGTVSFEATLDAKGRYGLFLDFKHGGRVHTAAFTFDQGTVTGAASMEH